MGTTPGSGVMVLVIVTGMGTITGMGMVMVTVMVWMLLVLDISRYWYCMALTPVSAVVMTMVQGSGQVL